MNTDCEQDREKALEVAYRFLGKRDRTVAEVRQKLEKAGFEAGPSDAAVETLLEQRYLDDARFARRFAEDRRALDGWGIERIRLRLIQVGVPRDVIDAAVQRPAVDERRDAIAVLRNRLSEPPRGLREQDRALGILLRRGYSVDVAREAVRALDDRAAA